MEYASADLYIKCGKTIKEKIKKLDDIIDALLDVALKAAASDNITEYSLDDGQTKIKTLYRGAGEVYTSIAKFKRLRVEYINELNGRTFRLVDSKNFKRRY